MRSVHPFQETFSSQVHLDCQLQVRFTNTWSFFGHLLCIPRWQKAFRIKACHYKAQWITMCHNYICVCKNHYHMNENGRNRAHQPPGEKASTLCWAQELIRGLQSDMSSQGHGPSKTQQVLGEGIFSPTPLNYWCTATSWLFLDLKKMVIVSHGLLAFVHSGWTGFKLSGP